MNPQELTRQLKLEAQRLGFARAGACAAVTPQGIDRFGQWLAAGYAGEMHYLPDRAAAYEHPAHVLDGARSLLILAVAYRTDEPRATLPGEGRIARYAWGEDYHEVIRQRLNALADRMRELVPAAKVRGVVDTAPLLEREFAQLAGLGWVGKNTLLLDKQLGSWFFLAALVTDQELAYDQPHESSHCGTCRACLDACPTDAFVDAYVLDASRCLSYTTIELRTPIPPELRAAQGDWLFGCDVCQEVCPWNRKPACVPGGAFWPRAENNPIGLAKLFELDDDGFRQLFRDTPLWRPKRRGILRNAAIVLGNQRHADSLPALAKGLQDVEPLVRGAAAWALGQYRSEAARQLLIERINAEADEEVRQEIHAGLAIFCSGQQDRENAKERKHEARQAAIREPV
jgi:epoxyqueuosine reductase